MAEMADPFSKVFFNVKYFDKSDRDKAWQWVLESLAVIWRRPGRNSHITLTEQHRSHEAADPKSQRKARLHKRSSCGRRSFRFPPATINTPTKLEGGPMRRVILFLIGSVLAIGGLILFTAPTIASDHDPDHHDQDHRDGHHPGPRRRPRAARVAGTPPKLTTQCLHALLRQRLKLLHLAIRLPDRVHSVLHSGLAICPQYTPPTVYTPQCPLPPATLRATLFRSTRLSVRCACECFRLRCFAVPLANCVHALYKLLHAVLLQ